MAMLVYELCPMCNTAFAKKKGNQRMYCSKLCKKKANQAKKTTYWRSCANPNCDLTFITTCKTKLYCDERCRKTHAAVKFQLSLEKEHKECSYENCGVTFLANKKQKYCCKEHAAMQKRVNDRRRYANG